MSNANSETNKINEPAVEPATDFSQTIYGLIDDVCGIVSATETVKDYWGDDVPRYYFCDIQDNLVIVMDRADRYNYYSVPYTVEGDKPVLNFEEMKRVKVQYVDYVDGEAPIEGAFNFADEQKNFEEAVSAKISELTTERDDFSAEKDKAVAEYEAVQTELDEIKPKYEAYAKAEEERLEAEAEARKDEIIANYEVVLNSNEDFTALKEKKTEMSADEIESQCAVLYAKSTLYSAQNNKKSEPMSVGIVEPTHDDNVVETKYGMIAKSN